MPRTPGRSSSSRVPPGLQVPKKFWFSKLTSGPRWSGRRRWGTPCEKNVWAPVWGKKVFGPPGRDFSLNRSEPFVGEHFISERIISAAEPLSAGIAGRRARRLRRARAARLFRERTTRFNHTEAKARKHVERFHCGVLRRRRRDARGSGSREGGRPQTRKRTRDRPRRRRRSHEAQVPRRPRVSGGG